MSYQYASFPKVKLSFPTTNLSYCYIKYVGNTTATSTVVYSGKLTGGAYTSNDLSLNTLYTFTLTPLDSTDVSGIVKTITVDTTPKNAGTKNTTGRSTMEATTLQWGGTSYDYYKVSRSLKGTTAYSDISTNVTSNTYYDNDLSGNSVYYYYVTPYKNDGTAYTAATPIYIYTNVRAPTDMSSTVYDSSSITMTWKTKNSYDTSYYNVVYVKNNTTGAIITASGDIQSYTATDLSKNTTYTCYAQTYLLSAGSTVTATTASPYVGGNITLYSVSMNSITVSWSGQYLSYVTVSRRVGTTASYTDICGADYASPYVDGDISGNTTYYYYVTPKLGLFSGSASSVVSSTTPVAYPTDVSATFYDTSAIRLAFTAPKNSYSSTVAYRAEAWYSGNIYGNVTGTSPILMQNLSSGTTYTCYIKVTLDSAYFGSSIGLSVTTTDSGITAIPIYTAASTISTWTSTTKTISGATGSYAYANGTYVISYSSTATDGATYAPANNTTTTFWHAAYQPQSGYSQHPYNSSGTYQGGGTGYYYTTTVSSTSYAGEWFQYKLPYSLKVTSYGIMPRATTLSRTIKSFLLAGSTDGSTWTLIDYQSNNTLTDYPATLTKISVSSSSYYTYFRFIFTATAGSDPFFIHMSQLNLYGTALV